LLFSDRRAQKNQFWFVVVEVTGQIFEKWRPPIRVGSFLRLCSVRAVICPETKEVPKSSTYSINLIGVAQCAFVRNGPVALCREPSLYLTTSAAILNFSRFE
jgi:hypothetical protein